MWRLDQGRGVVRLQLPLLYTSGRGNEDSFNVDQCRGKLVVVYFWSSTSSQVSEDFETLKQITDRHGRDPGSSDSAGLAAHDCHGLSSYSPGSSQLSQAFSRISVAPGGTVVSARV